MNIKYVKQENITMVPTVERRFPYGSKRRRAKRYLLHVLYTDIEKGQVAYKGIPYRVSSKFAIRAHSLLDCIWNKTNKTVQSARTVLRMLILSQ